MVSLDVELKSGKVGESEGAIDADVIEEDVDVDEERLVVPNSVLSWAVR